MKQYKDQAEESYLRQLLEYTEGHVTRACRVAGLSRSRFYALMTKHGIDPQKCRGIGSRFFSSSASLSRRGFAK